MYTVSPACYTIQFANYGKLNSAVNNRPAYCHLLTVLATLSHQRVDKRKSVTIFCILAAHLRYQVNLEWQKSTKFKNKNLI